jgi:predicted nucleic acid-binding protein
VTVIVVDASVLITALADDAADGDGVRAELRGQALVAPELIDLEVLSALRRQVLSGRLPVRRADLALRDLVELPLRRAPHAPFAGRCWELRANLTPYDAAYVAVAEALRVPLLTADQGIAAAPGVRCEVRLIA